MWLIFAILIYSIESVSKMAIYCPQGSGTLRQQYTLLYSVILCYTLLCSVILCYTLFCQSRVQVIPKSSPSCPQVVPKMSQVIIIDAQLNPYGIHEASRSSPVIAFDIAFVAQKVKEMFLSRTGVIWKSGWWWWWCCWVTSRSGWLLELLTELTIILGS